MIDPTKVLIATPTLDGKVEMGYAGGLMSAASGHMFGNIIFLQSVSHISLARDLMAHSFMRTDYEWMVFIDSDIQFSPEDFRILMDYPRRGPASADFTGCELNPEGTTVNSYGEALIVCAEYARKVDSLDPAQFGLGFCRIHRSVFETLQNARDDEGAPRVGQFVHKGEMYDHFFPSGPGFEGVWFGEDTGFFHLCRLCGITPRVETRTRLIHVGRKVYPYLPTGISDLPA